MRSPRGIHTFYDPVTKIWSGTKTPSLYNPKQSLGELVLAILAKTPDAISQISADSGVRMTCAEMRLHTIRVAQNLTNLGYTQRDTFTMAVRNGELVAPVLFACFALGIPVNTLDASFKRDELSNMLSTVKPRLVFCDQETLDEMKFAIVLAAVDPVVVIFGQKVARYKHVEELIMPTGLEDQFVPIHLENPTKHLAIILCSSGTTGPSKGVCLSHSLCIANITNFLQCQPTDVLLCFSSLYWLSGFGFLILGTISGAPRVITRDAYNPQLAMNYIEKHRVTVMFLPPAPALELLRHPNAHTTDFSSMRLGFSGGATVSADIKHSFEKLAPNAKFHVGYGLSEAGGVVAMSDNTYKAGSTGYLKPTTQAKIVNDSGIPMETGEEGEILVKKEYCFLGYYRNIEATAETLDNDGWLHTGDIGRFDEDGLLYVIDRKKDIIKYSNYQISPSELDTVIQAIPGVLNACVVGIPIPGNDLPAALVIRASGADISEDSIHHVVNSTLSNFKQLRGGVYFINELPMTPSGKVLRRKCREIVIKMYNNENDMKAQ